MMKTNVKDYFLEENEEEFRKVFRHTMEGHFEHDLFNKSFTNQLDSDGGQKDTLQQRIKWWMLVVDRGGPILDNVYEYNL